MSKVQIQFKDPDLIYEIIQARHPLPENEDDITPRMEKERQDFSRNYFEFGDYGVFEVDTETMAGRLLLREEWK
ncbi:hypothetical protein [Rhodoferax sp. GW822-FHT02A01]|uniref:hypothetical protein n=1 Tax=Rhodoferax sp. GW822-FHT02A01 TaxID=3141537 RepID=UPI00315CF0AE